MKADVQILKLSDVEKIFSSLLLTEKEGAGIKKAVLRDAMSGIVKDAKANLRSDGNVKSGSLLKALSTIVKVRGGTAYAASGARAKGKASGYHFHYINSGTAIRANQKGSNRGSVNGTEFFDRAVLSNMSKIPDVLQQAFDRRMAIFMEKKY